MIERSEMSDHDAAASGNSKARFELRIHRIKLVTRRYWWILALTVMIGLLVQDYRFISQPARYVSFSRMMVGGHLSLPQGQVYTDDYSNFFGTQVALMKSRETYTQAVDRVNTLYPDVAIDSTAEIEAGIEPKTSIFDLKVTSVDPDYAKLMLDAVMDTYLASKRGRKNQTTDEAVSAVTEEISHLDAAIRNDEQQLLDFQKQNNVVFIEEQSASSATYLVGLNNELASLIKEHGLLTLENQDPLINASDYAKSGMTNSAPDSGSVDNSYARDANAIVAEQDYIEKLQILRDEYGVYLKDLHPKMVSLADAISKEQKFLELLKSRNIATRDAHREDLELQIKNLEEQISVWNTKSLELSERLGTYQQLKSKITREQTLYDQLAASIQTVDMNKSLDQDFVVIMEAASKAKLIDPNYPLQIFYGIVGGLIAGIGVIYFVNRFDHRIDSPLELMENIDYPIVGQIPLVKMDKQTKRVPLLSDNDERHEFLEHHRYIRSAIMFQSHEAHRPRSLMISSATPSEGKSTLTANLAAVFAHAGSRTLLIDADLRRGVQHTLFDLPVGPGLSDYLQGEIPWREIVRETGIPNLDLIPRGKVSRRAGDLLLGPAIDILLQESVAGDYDMVLWDSAPLLATNDASNMCSKVEGVLFVARVRHCTLQSVQSALEDLSRRHAKIYGIVLNAVEPDQPGYYDRYRYKEYYAVTAEV